MRGQHKDLRGAGDCVSCDGGKISASGAGTCTDCDLDVDSVPGSSECVCNPGNTVPNNWICTQCVAGRYKIASGFADCIKCGAGKYSDEAGATSHSSCLKCPPNSTSLAGSSVCVISSKTTTIMKMFLSLPMTKKAFTLDTQGKFKMAPSKAAGVLSTDITIHQIISVAIGGRRLLTDSIRVENSIIVPINHAFHSIELVKINSELEKVGLPPALILSQNVLSVSDSSAVVDIEPKLPFGGPWGVLGVTFGLSIAFICIIKNVANGGILTYFLLKTFQLYYLALTM